MKDNRILPASGSVGTALRGQSNPRPRILVVEDALYLRQVSTKVLIQHGYNVRLEEDGAAGWEALNTGSHDLLITDSAVPKLSGAELLKKLRAADMTLPVIMITGGLPEESSRYSWPRPDATLLRSFTAAEMLSAVKKVLRKAKDESACFESLIQDAQQLNFEWELIISNEAASCNDGFRKSHLG